MKVFAVIALVAFSSLGTWGAEKSDEVKATAMFKRHIANLATVERRGDDIQIGWTDVKYEVKRQNSTLRPFTATLAAVRFTGKDAASGLKVNYQATLVYEDSRWVLSTLLVAFPDVDNSPPEPVSQGSTGWKTLSLALKLLTD